MLSASASHIVSIVENESSNPSPEEAARALADLAEGDRAFAARIVTPRWYYPIYAVFVGLMTISIAIPLWGSMIALVCIVGFVSLIKAYQRRYGVVFPRPAGRRSKSVLAVLICILVACLIASSVIGYSSLSLWFIAIPTITNTAAAYFLGNAYDNAMRKDIAGE